MAVSTCHHFNISINISQVSGTPLLLIHDQQTFNHLDNRKNNFEQEKHYSREHGPSLLGCGWYCLDLVTIINPIVSLVVLVVCCGELDTRLALVSRIAVIRGVTRDTRALQHTLLLI